VLAAILINICAVSGIAFAIGRKPMGKHEQFIQETLAKLMDMETNDLSRDIPFDQLGVDSLTGLRLARKIQDGLGFEFDPEWIYDYPSVSRLGKFLDENICNRPPQA
jgi:acyl carrier protein